MPYTYEVGTETGHAMTAAFKMISGPQPFIVRDDGKRVWTGSVYRDERAAKGAGRLMANRFKAYQEAAGRCYSDDREGVRAQRKAYLDARKAVRRRIDGAVTAALDGRLKGVDFAAVQRERGWPPGSPEATVFAAAWAAAEGLPPHPAPMEDAPPPL